MSTTDVLVVGAGPAGLATAISALRNGARALVLERRPGPSTLPRANGVSVRSMELFRFWGIAGAVRAGAIDCEPVSEVVRVLAGRPRDVTPLARASARQTLAVSPALPALVPQDHIEPLLVERVRALGGTVRFGAAVTGLRTSSDGVRAEVDGGGGIRARYVVGADGPRSTVRAALGIGWQRLGTVGRYEHVLFRPDRAMLVGCRPAALSFVQHPDAGGVLLPIGSGRWAFVHPVADSAVRTLPDHIALLRTATGLADLRPEVLRTQRFTMAADVATGYRSGPGFLVGDAAHRMTPFGGIGMNTALHDGHELGWRLAWAVRGLAGDALLDSYGAEREPVGRANAGRTLSSERHPDDGLPRDLGGLYRSRVIAARRDRPGPRAAGPGERAPHVWIRRDGRRCSVLDLFDAGLTLVTAAPAWRRAADRIAEPTLRVLAADDLGDGRDRLVAAYRLGAGAAVLVRPDGVVAWRHDSSAAAPALSAAVSMALGRQAPVRMATA
jgi:putative polyketide hydroxylase